MSRSSCISPPKSSVGALRRYGCTMVDRLPHLLLRLEGLAVAAASVVLYFQEDFGWVLFVALILAPDLSASRLCLRAEGGGDRL